MRMSEEWRVTQWVRRQIIIVITTTGVIIIIHSGSNT